MSNVKHYPIAQLPGIKMRGLLFYYIPFGADSESSMSGKIPGFYYASARERKDT